MAITNLYEFYDDSKDNPKEKSQLEQVTEVNNSPEIKVDAVGLASALTNAGYKNLKTVPTESGTYIVTYNGLTSEMTKEEYDDFCKSIGVSTDEETGTEFSNFRRMAQRGASGQLTINEVPKNTSNVFDPSNTNNDIDISELNKSSELVGKAVADLVSDAIAPAIENTLNDIVTELNEEESVTVSENTSKSSMRQKIQNRTRYNIEIVTDSIHKEVSKSVKNDLEDSYDDFMENDITRSEYEVELKDNIYRQVDSFIDKLDIDDLSHLDSVYKKMGESVVDTAVDTLNTTSTVGADLISDIIDLTVGSIMITPVESAINATNDIIESVGSIVNEELAEFDGFVNTFRDMRDQAVDAFTNKLIGAGRDWVRNKLDEAINKPIEELNDRLRTGFTDALNRLPWMRGPNDPPPIHYEDFSGINKTTGEPYPFSKLHEAANTARNESLRLDKTPMILNRRGSDLDYLKSKWEYLRNVRENGKNDLAFYRFATTYDWLISIKPHSYDPDFPSLTKCLGLADDQYLPILNYTLVEESLESLNYNFISSNVTIPSGYRRPSKLTITLPDIYVAKSGEYAIDPKSYLRKFKEDYIRWVKIPSDEDQIYSLVSRDYRYCCYEITIYRFPYVSEIEKPISKLDDVSFRKTYLALPDISITDSGSDSKQLITEQLSFSIVGEVE